MKVEFITREDLQEFKNEIVKEVTSANQNHVTKKWLRSKEVRDMLSISPGTLQNMRINGTLPFAKLGSTIFYDLEEINKILTENKSA